ncbi:MAG: acyltransferase [Verrucomicrobiia bacterium]
MRTFLFYLRYYLNNHWVGHFPCHAVRIWWYRHVMKMTIGHGTNIQLGVLFYGNCIRDITVGEGSVIHPRCVFNASAPIIIGNNVHIAHAVEFYTVDHDADSPSFEGRTGPIRVEDHVWIGARATILKGVTLGKGAVVATGAVVTRPVDPYAIVGGVPAKVLRQRSPEAKNPAVHGKPPLFC